MMAVAILLFFCSNGQKIVTQVTLTNGHKVFIYDDGTRSSGGDGNQTFSTLDDAWRKQIESQTATYKAEITALKAENHKRRAEIQDLRKRLRRDSLELALFKAEYYAWKDSTETTVENIKTSIVIDHAHLSIVDANIQLIENGVKWKHGKGERSTKKPNWYMGDKPKVDPIIIMSPQPNIPVATPKKKSRHSDTEEENQ